MNNSQSIHHRAGDTPQRQDTIYSLQALRALAATMVVLFHAYVHLDVRNIIAGISALVDAGRAGVDIFFVISGFIMVYISRDSFGKPGASRDFIIRRTIRVVPVYWFYTFLIATILYMLPQLFSEGKSFSLEHLVASLLFVPWQNSIGDIKPVLNVGWTLNFEMYFYLLFALMLPLKQQLFLPLLSLVMLCGATAGFTGGPYPTLLHVVTSPMLIEFLTGCFIGSWYIRCHETPKYLGCYCFCPACSALSMRPESSNGGYLQHWLSSAHFWWNDTGSPASRRCSSSWGTAPIPCT